MPCPYNVILGRDTALPIGVNLRSNPVRDCCLTIKLRSPLAKRTHPQPLRGGEQEGGDRSLLKVPLPPLGGARGGGDLGGSGLGYKRDFSRVSGLS